MDVEVYSIGRWQKSGSYHQTMFILELPTTVISDILDTTRRKRLIEVPHRIHTNLFETALARWGEGFYDMAQFTVTGHMRAAARERFNAEGDVMRNRLVYEAEKRFNAEEIVMLSRHMYQTEHQIAKEKQVLFNIICLHEEFERMQKRDPSVAEVLGDIFYLQRQAQIIDGKYLHLKSQLQNLMELVRFLYLGLGLGNILMAPRIIIS
jgi:hypothetical protein